VRTRPRGEDAGDLLCSKSVLTTVLLAGAPKTLRSLLGKEQGTDATLSSFSV
jgi:hypothetical protein